MLSLRTVFVRYVTELLGKKKEMRNRKKKRKKKGHPLNMTWNHSPLPIFLKILIFSRNKSDVHTLRHYHIICKYNNTEKIKHWKTQLRNTGCSHSFSFGKEKGTCAYSRVSSSWASEYPGNLMGLWQLLLHLRIFVWSAKTPPTISKSFSF